MARSGKVLVWVLGGLAVLAAALVVLVAFFDWNLLKPWLNTQASEALKRPFAIEGELAVRWRRPADEPGWRAWVPWPQVSAESLRLGNPAWASGERFVSLARVEFELSPLALLDRTLHIPGIRLSGLDASLERQADGRANWVLNLGGGSEGRAPWRFDIGTVQFDRGRLRVDDRILDAALQVDVEHLGEPIPFEQVVGKVQAGHALREGARPQDYVFAWTVTGDYRGRPLAGEGRLGGLLALEDARLPFPVQADLRVGKTRFRAEGVLVAPLQLGSLDLRLRLSGDSLADLYPLIGVTLPETAAYRTGGRLTADLRDPGGARYRYRDFRGRIGESDIQGELSYVMRRPRPLLSGELTSGQLVLRDLAPLIGADSGTGKSGRAQPAGKVLPVEEFRTGRWRGMDADVRFAGKRIVHDKALPVTDLATHVRLEDGLLRLEPLRLGVAGGRLEGQVALDGRQTPLDGRLRLNIRGLALKRLFPTLKAMRDSLGELNGDASLHGRGNSLAALLGTADGDLKLLVDGGTLSRTLMEIAGLNVGNFLVELLFGDEAVVINCAAADIGFKNGLATPRLLVLDTEKALVTIDGSVDFKRERLDLDILPRFKDVRLASLRSPLYVRGTFKHPDPGVHPEGLIVRGAGMLVLGAALAPAAGLLALVAPGGGEPSRCGPMLERIRRGGAD